MWLIVRSSRPARQRVVPQRRGSDIGTKILLLPFALVGSALLGILLDLIGLVLLALLALYLARSYGINLPSADVIAEYAKQHLHLLLLYGGLAFLVVGALFRILWWMVSSIWRTNKRR